MNMESQREVRDIALPSGLVQVEYLESDGRQYIDTGIPVVKNDDNYYISVEIKFSANSIQNDKWVFGSYNHDIGDNYNYLVGIYENQWCVGQFNKNFKHPAGIPTISNVTHTVKVNLDVDGVGNDGMTIVVGDSFDDVGSAHGGVGIGEDVGRGGQDSAVGAEDAKAVDVEIVESEIPE